MVANSGLDSYKQSTLSVSEGDLWPRLIPSVGDIDAGLGLSFGNRPCDDQGQRFYKYAYLIIFYDGVFVHYTHWSLFINSSKPIITTYFYFEWHSLAQSLTHWLIQYPCIELASPSSTAHTIAGSQYSGITFRICLRMDWKTWRLGTIIGSDSFLPAHIVQLTINAGQ